MKLFITVLLMMLAGPVVAENYWEYGAWSVWVDEVDTGQDLRRTCTALTGGDGAPSVAVVFSNGDAGPPDVFPSVIVQETAPRGYDTVL